MIYFDTSFLVPLILPEATSDEIAAVIRGVPPGQLAVSHWTRVEFSSLLAREVRMGGLSADLAGTVDVRFEAMVEESFVVLSPSPADFALAKRFLRSYSTGLRGGDALHLAIAANHGAKVMYSLDRTLLKAGALLGVTVSRGIGDG